MTKIMKKQLQDAENLLNDDDSKLNKCLGLGQAGTIDYEAHFISELERLREHVAILDHKIKAKKPPRFMTMKQIERQMNEELKALDLGCAEWHEFGCVGRGGKVILGRHIDIYLGPRKVRRDVQNKIVAVFRKYWHRGCKWHSFRPVRYNGRDDIHSVMEITF